MAKQNFCVARVETRTRASVGKFERHIERKNESYENMNVDLSRTPMNGRLLQPCLSFLIMRVFVW